MKVKTSDLIGEVLDWAVAKALGATELHFDTVACWWFNLNGEDHVLAGGVGRQAQFWAPSVDWSQGGPIIEREKIGVWWDGQWHAKYDGCKPNQVQDAYAPLIAAMRCYVSSKLGDEVEIPDILEQGDKL